MKNLLRPIALTALLGIGAAACSPRARYDPPTPSTTPNTTPADAVLPEVKIAFVENLAPDGAAQRVAPAFQGARLAVDAAVLAGRLQADVRLVPLDTGGTPDGIRQVAAQILGDASFVAAVAAPQLSGQVSLFGPLQTAGVPTISLSTLGPNLPLPAWTTWRRAVPDVAREAGALARAVGAIGGLKRVCLVGDGSPASTTLLHGVRDALTIPPTLRLSLPDTDPDDPTVIAAIRGARCRSVVWAGTPTGGALLRLALVEAGLREIRLFGGESLKDASYISTAGPRGRGTVAVCPCVDLSTSTDLRAQRFIQDYQSEFGVPPGPFAAEGWDVARMLLAALEAGARTRAQVADALAEVPTFEGLARTYVFGPDGELRDQSDAVRAYRDEGVRWVPVELPDG